MPQDLASGQPLDAFAAPTFRGSISRRFTFLCIHFLVVIAIIGGLSVYKTRRIVHLHTEIGDLAAHIEALDRLETAILHLQAETQDALFLGEALDDPGLDKIPRRIREQSKHYEQLHSHDGQTWETGSSLERDLYQELDPRLDKFILVARSVVGARRGCQAAGGGVDADHRSARPRGWTGAAVCPPSGSHGRSIADG
jgi:hypothetical protein